MSLSEKVRGWERRVGLTALARGEALGEQTESLDVVCGVDCGAGRSRCSVLVLSCWVVVVVVVDNNARRGGGRGAEPAYRAKEACRAIRAGIDAVPRLGPRPADAN